MTSSQSDLDAAALMAGSKLCLSDRMFSKHAPSLPPTKTSGVQCSWQSYCEHELSLLLQVNSTMKAGVMSEAVTKEEKALGLDLLQGEQCDMSLQDMGTSGQEVSTPPDIVRHSWPGVRFDVGRGQGPGQPKSISKSQPVSRLSAGGQTEKSRDAVHLHRDWPAKATICFFTDSKDEKSYTPALPRHAGSAPFPLQAVKTRKRLTSLVIAGNVGRSRRVSLPWIQSPSQHMRSDLDYDGASAFRKNHKNGQQNGHWQTAAIGCKVASERPATTKTEPLFPQLDTAPPKHLKTGDTSRMGRFKYTSSSAEADLPHNDELLQALGGDFDLPLNAKAASLSVSATLGTDDEAAAAVDASVYSQGSPGNEAQKVKLAEVAKETKQGRVLKQEVAQQQEGDAVAQGHGHLRTNKDDAGRMRSYSHSRPLPRKHEDKRRMKKVAKIYCTLSEFHFMDF